MRARILGRRTIGAAAAAALLILLLVVALQVAYAAISTDFKQCANGTASDGDLGDCDWIGSILQANNSTYYEGMSVAQRSIFYNIEAQTGDVHTLTFAHDATKGGIHAYDFLTSYDQAVAAAADAGVPFNDFDGQACDGLTGTALTICNLRTGANCIEVTVPDDPFISKDGSTQSRIDAYEAIYGNRTVRICSDQPISAGALALSHSVANGADTGDSEILYTLTYTSTGSQLLFEMATHIAVSGDPAINPVAWGIGLGASNISGGPYHVNLGQLDGAALGSQDNQIKGADILVLPGSIIVDKVTDPSGDPTSFDFELRDGADALLSSFALTDTQQPFDSGPLDAGTYYVEELGPPTGWALDSIICVDPSGGTTTLDNTATIDLAQGEDVTCTFYDSRLPSYLTLVKTVINDNGGSLLVGDFPLFIDGMSATSGEAYEVEPYVQLTVTETQQSGYTASAWGTDCAPDGTITLSAGESMTCTITNDDQQAYVTVVKNVTNDDGGSALPDDFLLTLEGNSVSSGVAVPVDPGTYTAGETLLPGYTFEGFSGDCDSNGDTTVALGESKTCTLTNNDQQAYVTVVKSVTNDDGGTALPNDFLLTLEGNSVSSGVAVPVDPGTYTAGETLLPGYTFEGFSGDCDSNGDTTVALGESKTCTLTNNDQQASITVVKVVTNDDGGTALPNDFLLTLEGNSVTSGVAVPVDPGTYTAGETLLPGYTFEGFSGDCDSNGDVTVALGESKTCTLTNNDQPAYLTVIKHVINDDGWSYAASDFTMTINGVTVIGGTSFAGAESPGVTRQVYPGTYNVTENGPAPYAASYSADCSGTIALGESKTCTVTNDDLKISIDIEKWTNGQDADAPIGPYVHKGDPINWTYKVTNTGDVPLSNVSVTDSKGVTVSCPQNTLGIGETMTCTASGIAIEGQYVNQGTAEGYYESIKTSDVDLSHYFGIDPCIKLVKLGPTSATIGSKLTYVFRVTNCSAATPLDNVKLSDPRFPGMGVVNLGHLDPGQSKQHIYVYTVKESDGTEIINVAKATGKDPLGKVVTDTDDWFVPIKPKEPPEEFVPEWSSLALLASALAPLAGYARMRRRKK